MAQQLQTVGADTSCLYFNFDDWLLQYELTNVKQLFIDHEMYKIHDLSMENKNFSALMVDERVLAQPQLIPKIITAMQSIKHKYLTNQFNKTKLVFVSNEENEVISAIKAHIEGIETIRDEVKTLNIEYENKKLNDRQTTSNYIEKCSNKLNDMNNEITKIFGDLREALNKKEEELKNKINEYRNELDKFDTNNLDEKTNEIQKIIDTADQYLKDKIISCKDIIRTYNTDNDNGEHDDRYHTDYDFIYKKDEERKNKIIVIGNEAETYYDKMIEDISMQKEAIIEYIEDDICKNNNNDNEDIQETYSINVDKLVFSDILKDIKSFISISSMDDAKNDDDKDASSISRYAENEQLKTEMISLQNQLKELKNNTTTSISKEQKTNDVDVDADWYDAVRPISLYDRSKWNISSNSIRGSIKDQGRYMLYGQDNTKNKGYNKGIHYWSIKKKGTSYYLYIGITTKRLQKSVSQKIEGWHAVGCNYYFKSGWTDKDVIFTVKLDCNKWSVAFYKNNFKQKENKIVPNKSYHLAMVSGTGSKYISVEYELVKTDILRIKENEENSGSEEEEERKEGITYIKPRGISLYDGSKFNIWGIDKTQIQGLGSCSGYMIFSKNDTNNNKNKGYNKGIHYWSLKKYAGNCYSGIGITTKRERKSVQNGVGYWHSVGCNYYHREKWDDNQVITVRLDCDKWIVAFFKDWIKFRENEIENNKFYHFAASFCAKSAHYECVETDLNSIMNNQDDEEEEEEEESMQIVKARGISLWDKSKYNVYGVNNTIIQGLGDCNGYMLFANDDTNNKGYNKGIHYWSVKQHHGNCYKGIGITTSRNKKSIKENTCYWHSMGINYYDGNNGWSTNNIMTVKLDCDDWNVTIYKDSKEIKSEKIKKNKSYHFAISICASGTHYECVNTDLSSLS